MIDIASKIAATFFVTALVFVYSFSYLSLVAENTRLKQNLIIEREINDMCEITLNLSRAVNNSYQGAHCYPPMANDAPSSTKWDELYKVPPSLLQCK